jgi:hypothetical protein
VSDLTDPVDPQFVREFAEATITQPVPPDYLDMLIAECCKVPARVWKATFEGLVEADVPTESGTITAPTPDPVGRPGPVLLPQGARGDGRMGACGSTVPHRSGSSPSG